MKVIERYAAAAVADDLKDRGPYCDLHILTAAGMAGVSDTWATSLFRLKYCNDPKEYDACLSGAKVRARSMAIRRNWNIDPSAISRLAKKTLDYWLADICPTCLGRGASTIPGTPILEDQPCDQCGGTGRTAPTFQGNTREYAVQLLFLFQDAEGRAGGRMMAKLADEINMAITTKSP